MLGLASPEERNEFEQMCRQHPEIRAARDAFEQVIEKQTMAAAVPPPAGLKEKLWDRIDFTAPVGATDADLTEKAPAPVVKMGWLKYAAAACLILLAGSIYWNLSLQQENKAIKESLATSQSQADSVKSELASIRQEGQIIARVGDDQKPFKMAALKGTAFSPASFATVYWDTTSKDVYLMVNNLPKPASDEQYQLWALLNGQPIDMGVLTISEKPLQLYHMKNAQDAQAFAITIEPKGGSVNPTLEKMIAVGNL